MAYVKMLADDIGNLHERKNIYLRDISEASKEEAKHIKANRDRHPYIVELNEFRRLEHEHKEANNKKAQEEAKACGYNDKFIEKLYFRLRKAEGDLKFYEKYVDLTYDAELEYKRATLEISHIPQIIENDIELKKRLDDAEENLKKVNGAARANALREIETRKSERKKALDEEIRSLKNKAEEGLISKKAVKNGISMAKRAYKEDCTAMNYLDEEKSLKDEIKNLKHHIKLDPETMLKVLEFDISDIRRKIPVETEQNFPLHSFLGLPVPGLAQLLNRQYIKAAIFFIGTLFIYLMAIPYALGYGNYQGKGVSGLISLAAGGRKIDKSIIFMIEGIIAIILLLFAFAIYYLAFRDSYDLERKKIKGIRPFNWFETKQSVERSGFPYIVLSPALIVITFIVLVPIITTLLISFTNLDPSHQNKFSWVGLSNYKMMLVGNSLAGKAFWLILMWTLIWTFASSTLAIFIGFVLSLLLNQERVKGKLFFRTIYLLPWAVPAFISIMYFSLMVSKGGPIPELIHKIFGFTPDIKNATIQTRIALILLQGWLGSAYIFLLSTGVLQGIPNDLYEAAEIDGATGFQRTLKITVPLVLFQTAPLLISQYTFNFNNFSIIYLFNQGGPFNPTLYGNLAGSSDLLISYIYKLTIEKQYQGIGAAITVLISFALMFFAYLGFRRTKSFKED